MYRPSVKIAALRLNGIAGSAEVIDWAIQALKDAQESPSVVQLAGYNASELPNEFEIDECFKKSLMELNGSLLSREEYTLAHARDIAAEMMEGRISPSDGCVQLKRLAKASDLDALSTWIAIDQDLWLAKSGSGGAGDEEVASSILAAASKLHAIGSV